MKLFRVLHLSDIHIGDTYMNSKDIAYRIISDIENENIRNIRCIVVTGDIFEGKYGLEVSLVSEAVDFFNILFEELKTTTNIEKTDFLFVPGNHDIVRSADFSERWKKYRYFLEAFYGTIPDFYNSDDFSLLKIYDDSRIVFAGFNSCGLKEEELIDSKVIKDLSKIDDLQFDNLAIPKKDLIEFINKQTKEKVFVDFGEIPPEQILKVKRKLCAYSDYNITAFFHHHFYLFPEIYSKYGDSSLIRNYTNVIQQMQQIGVKNVLHGHKHFDLERPLITDLYYDNPNNIINIIAGGSVGTKRVSKHTFNIIDFYDGENNYKLVQRKFIYNNDQLEPIALKEIPPEVSNNYSSIKLLNTFKVNEGELFSKYEEAIEKINIVADDYNNMIKWLENIFIGFEEIHKIFNNNSLCVFFLLFAMNYRILKIKQVLGKENIDISYYNILNKLLFEDIPEIGMEKKKYVDIFEESDLNKLKEKGDEILGTLQNKKAKYYLSFSMIGIFITDIYLMLRYYAGSFYKRHIKYKVNIKLDETEFHQNIPVQKIMIHSDADRRSAFIDLRCNSATAHKLAVLFVKEFELIISKYEDYFKIVGLKLYYLMPKIEKNVIPNAIDNYNFEAYIPTLIPLLTGDNIYAKKEVFARELIQNSIDAIAVRASKEDDFDKRIYITLGQIQGRRFFRIKDYGTGMDRFKIERYFTSIGRSFYSGDEYRDLELDYKPISNFGIGFLSAFMICREIDVKTRYFTDEKEGLKLHIPNYDGCFFIEKDDSLDIGTEITLYIDKKISHDIKSDKIIEYIGQTMRDIKYDIVITDESNKQNLIIEAQCLRKNCNCKDILFVPFLEDGNIVNNIDVQKEIWSKDFIRKYSYGLLINLESLGKEKGNVLNAGIKLYDTDVNEVWKLLFHDKTRRASFYDDFMSFNFPSNYLNIDVSREKITDFPKEIQEEEFLANLLTEVYRQIQQYIELAKENVVDNHAINLHLLMMNLVHLSSLNSSLTQLRKNIMSMRYVLYIRYNDKSIDLLVSRVGNKPSNAIAYIQSNYGKCKEEFKKLISRNGGKIETNILSSKASFVYKFMPMVHEWFDSKRMNLLDRDLEEYFYRQYSLDNGFYLGIKEYLQKNLKYKKESIMYAFLLIAAFLEIEDEGKKHVSVMNNILSIMLESYTVSQIENDKCCITISYDDISKVIKSMK